MSSINRGLVAHKRVVRKLRTVPRLLSGLLMDNLAPAPLSQAEKVVKKDLDEVEAIAAEIQRLEEEQALHSAQPAGRHEEKTNEPN